MSGFSDIIAGIKIGLRYGATIRKGVEAANNNPEIVAAIAAGYAALQEFHVATASQATLQSTLAEHGIDKQAVIEELQKPGPQPEGPGNPSI